MHYFTVHNITWRALPAEFGIRAQVSAADAKGGMMAKHLGRTRGGFSTKIHLKTDLDGYPIGFHLTGGEASDSRNFEVLLDLGPDVDPRAVVADKGYDAKTNREAARKRGICRVIPYCLNTIDKPRCFAKVLYKARARIEQMMGRIKRFKRIALRCVKTARNYAHVIAAVSNATADVARWGVSGQPSASLHSGRRSLYGRASHFSVASQTLGQAFRRRRDDR